MPVAWRTASTNVQGNAGHATAGPPAGTVAGDLLIAVHVSDFDGSLAAMTAPAGWDLVDSRNATTSRENYVKIWKRTATSSEPTSYTFQDSTGANAALGILRIDGHDPNATISVVWAAAAASTSHTAPSVTGVVGGLLATVHTADTNGTVRSYAKGAGMPAAWTERVDIAQASSAYNVLGIFTEDLTSTAATGVRTATCSGSVRYVAASLVIPPPSVTAPTVNAGVDVTGHVVSTAFTRTATENANGGTITSRTWTIQAGPASVGSTIGTAAALTWTPTVAGTYTLRYAATNSAGTGTDDMTIEVIAPSAPTVNAGADVASHTVNTAFSRTATESANGSTITSRAWTATAWPASVTAGGTGVLAESGSFATAVASAYTNRVNSTGDESYDVPTAGQETSLRTALTQLAAGNLAGAASTAAGFGYEVVRHTDTDNSRVYAILRETTPCTKFWGFYVINLSAASGMVVEAPHVKADLHTHTQGAALFVKENAQAYLLSTTHRNANAATDGSGNRVSDLANCTGINPFQTAHEVLAVTGTYVVQIHGFADASEPAYDIVLSEGQPTPSSATEAVATALRNSAGAFRVGVYNGTVGAGLGATGNVQGIQSRSLNVPFLHVEQNTTLRSSATSRGIVEDTLVTSVPTLAAYGLRLGTTAALSWTPTTLGDYVLQYAATNGVGTSADTLSITVASGPPPPVVDAGQDSDAHTTDTTFTRTAVEDDSGSAITSRAWTITAGPAGVGSTIGTTAALSWTPSTVGQYSLQYAATNANGTGTDITHVTVVGVDAPSTTGRLPAHPGELLRIGPEPGRNHFNIGIGIDNGAADGYQSGDTVHTDQTTIAQGFTHGPPAQPVPKFVLTADRSAVQFRIGVNDGRTSSGVSYPRAELREQNADGSLAGWNGTVGTHWMKWRFRATRVAPTKPWVCMGQIHDSSSDLIRLQTESGGTGPTGLRLRARHTPPGGTESSYQVMSSYTVGQWVNGELWVVNGSLSLVLDGVTVLSGLNGATNGCYFKCGCYAQSNATTENGDSSQWFSTEIAYLGVWHTGQPTLAPPAYTGPLIAKPAGGFMPFFAA